MSKIAVFGTGAVGGYFGGRLAQAGEDVTFIARGQQLQALHESGLRVRSVAGDFSVIPARATDDPAAVGPVDTVLVGVKAWQVPAAAGAMAPLVGQRTLILPLQNGVEAPQQLAAVLGKGHVLGGLCRIISRVIEPGVVEHVGAEPYIAFGFLDRPPDGRLESLLAAFNNADGVTAEIPADIEIAMWRKFQLIAAFSGVGAVTRTSIGPLRQRSETRWLLEQALYEIYEVAIALDVGLGPEAISAAMAFLHGLPPEATASMQRDIQAGRSSELESQNGAVVRLAEQAGVDAPLHRFIYYSLLPQESRNRGRPL